MHMRRKHIDEISAFKEEPNGFAEETNEQNIVF